MDRRRIFLKNAALLTAVSLALRAIGMVFRIVLSNLLGAEGMGLYQIVMSVYLLAATLSSAGLSLAVTRLVSEEMVLTGRQGVHKIMQTAFLMASVAGSAVGTVLYFASARLAEGWVGEAGAKASLQVISLALPFMAVSAVLRGYFTARRRVGFTGISQLAEQLVRFGVCMGLLVAFGSNSTAFGCFLVLAADTVSEWFSFGFQFIGYRTDLRKLKPLQKMKNTPLQAGRRLTEIILPVAGVRILSSGLYTVENTLVPELIAGLERSLGHLQPRVEALSQWGRLKGMAIPLVMFPSTLLTAFVLLLIPELSEFRLQQKQAQSQRLIAQVLQLTLTAAIGMAAGLYLLAPQLCEVIYPDQQITYYLRVLAPLVPIMYLESVTEGILKGLGEQQITLWYAVINVAVRLGLIFLWVPQKGMTGFLQMMVVDNILTGTLHVNRVLRVMKLRINWDTWVIRPLISAGVMWLTGTRLVQQLVYSGWQKLPILAVAGGVSAVTYAAMLSLTGTLTLPQLMKMLKTGNKSVKNGPFSPQGGN